jgi:hypothetical protein
MLVAVAVVHKRKTMAAMVVLVAAAMVSTLVLLLPHRRELQIPAVVAVAALPVRGVLELLLFAIKEDNAVRVVL